MNKTTEHRIHDSLDILKGFPESEILEQVKQTLIYLLNQHKKMLRVLQDVQLLNNGNDTIDEQKLELEIASIIKHEERV